MTLGGASQAEDISWISTSTSEAWHTTTNWSGSVVPTSASHALFGNTGSSSTTYFNFGGSRPDHWDVGAITLAADATAGRTLRGNNDVSLGTGELRLYGIDTVVGGNDVTLLIENLSASTLAFTNGSSSVLTLALYTSGVINAVGQITVANPIIDDGNARGITKIGSGLLALTSTSSGNVANSTYSGGFTIEEGTVEFVTTNFGTVSDGSLISSPFGTGTLTLLGGQLRSSNTGVRTIYNSVSIGGTVTFGELSGQTGRILVSIDGGGSTTLTANSTLNVLSTATWDQLITGSASLTKTGAGTLDLHGSTGSNVSTYTGGFILEEGTVMTYGGSSTSGGVLVSSPFGLGALTLRGGTLASESSNSRTWSNAVMLDGDVILGTTGSGALTFSDNAAKTTTLTGDHKVTINNSQVTWAQPLMGSYRLTKDGPGTLILSSSTVGTYSGLTIKEGIVQISATNARPQTPSTPTADQYVLDGGTLQVTTTTAIAANSGIALGAAGGTISVGGTTITINSPISDLVPGEAGSLTKAGGGALTLTGANTYTGATTVTAGPLYLDGSLANSPVTVLSGAAFGGSGVVIEDITVNSGGTLAPGSRLSRGKLYAYGPVTLDAGSSLLFDLTGEGTGNFDALAAYGSVSLNGATFALTLGFQPTEGSTFLLIENYSGLAVDGLLTFGGVALNDGDTFTVTSGSFTQSFTIDYDYSDGTVTNSLAITAAVPEPSGGMLLSLGTLALAASFRRVRRPI